MSVFGAIGQSFAAVANNFLGDATQIVDGTVASIGSGIVNAALGFGADTPFAGNIFPEGSANTSNFPTSLFLQDPTFANTFYGATSGKFIAEPKRKFLFYIQFVGYGTNNFLDVPSFRVKTCELPGIQIGMETLNQYNKRRQIVTKREYNPISISFHDTNDHAALNLFRQYFTEYFYDGVKYTDGSSLDTIEYDALTPYGSWSNKGYGLNPAKASAVNPGGYFFKRINIYTFLDQEVVQYSLIHPSITSYKPDTLDSGEQGGHMEINLTLEYEDLSIRTDGSRSGNPIIDNYFGGEFSWEQANATKATSQTPDFSFVGNNPLGPISGAYVGQTQASQFNGFNPGTSTFTNPLTSLLFLADPSVTNTVSNSIFGGNGFNFGGIVPNVVSGAIQYNMGGLLGDGSTSQGFTDTLTGYVPSINGQLAASTQSILTTANMGKTLSAAVGGSLVSASLTTNTSPKQLVQWNGQQLSYTGQNQNQNPSSTLTTSSNGTTTNPQYGNPSTNIASTALVMTPTAAAYINKASDPGIQVGSSANINYVGTGVLPPLTADSAWKNPTYNNPNVQGNAGATFVGQFGGNVNNTTINRNLIATGVIPTTVINDQTIPTNFQPVPTVNTSTATNVVNVGGIVTSIK